jgi:hypothetical protein
MKKTKPNTTPIVPPKGLVGWKCAACGHTHYIPVCYVRGCPCAQPRGGKKK